MVVMEQQALFLFFKVLLVGLISGRGHNRCMMDQKCYVLLAHGLNWLPVIVGAVHLVGIDLPVDVTVRADCPVNNFTVHHWIKVDHGGLPVLSRISEGR